MFLNLDCKWKYKSLKIYAKFYNSIHFLIKNNLLTENYYDVIIILEISFNLKSYAEYLKTK